MLARGFWGIAMLRLVVTVVAVFLILAGAAAAAPSADFHPRIDDDGRLLVAPIETKYGVVDNEQQARPPAEELSSSALVAQAAMGNFYLYEFEQQSGPFSTEELIEQISIGNIGKSAYVWQPGMDEWAPIESIPDFAAAFPPEVELPRPYYVIEGGERVGPLTDSEMQIRIIELQSGAEDLAWKAGLADWTPLSEFPE